jgi:hypothetical protein
MQKLRVHLGCKSSEARDKTPRKVTAQMFLHGTTICSYTLAAKEPHCKTGKITDHEI